MKKMETKTNEVVFLRELQEFLEASGAPSREHVEVVPAGWFYAMCVLQDEAGEKMPELLNEVGRWFRVLNVNGVGWAVSGKKGEDAPDVCLELSIDIRTFDFAGVQKQKGGRR